MSGRTSVASHFPSTRPIQDGRGQRASRSSLSVCFAFASEDLAFPSWVFSTPGCCARRRSRPPGEAACGAARLFERRAVSSSDAAAPRAARLPPGAAAAESIGQSDPPVLASEPGRAAHLGPGRGSRAHGPRRSLGGVPFFGIFASCGAPCSPKKQRQAGGGARWKSWNERNPTVGARTRRQSANQPSLSVPLKLPLGGCGGRPRPVFGPSRRLGPRWEAERARAAAAARARWCKPSLLVTSELVRRPGSRRAERAAEAP